jgi:hypothetical protein
MKKHLYTIAFLALTTAGFAQTKISYGIRGGATNAYLQGDAVSSLQDVIIRTGGAVNAESKTGFYAGGFVNIPVSETFSIEPGITYTQKGYELNGGFGIKNTDIISARSRLNLGYVELPVLAKVNLSGLQLFAGPQIGYLANAELRTRAGALGFNFINDRRDVKSQFNDIDVSLTGGVGYEFGNGFRVQAAYDHGLSRINSGQSLEAYNRAVKVGVGYRF